MREFFGFGGYARTPEGYLSWQHLLFVSVLMALMIALAVTLGKAYKGRSAKEKNRVLIAAALSIDCVELFKIVVMCVRSSDALNWLYDLPLFLCSIQLITLPLAAFAKGRVKEAAMDFVCIFGLLGAVLGTYGAGNNYASCPVLSIDNVASGITHTISGFAALYIMLSGMASMRRKNIFITYSILMSFCFAAYVANIILDYNYMFLMAGDGTPYDILYNMVNGHPVAYPMAVVGLFLVYITAFYRVYYSLAQRRHARIAGRGLRTI